MRSPCVSHAHVFVISAKAEIHLLWVRCNTATGFNAATNASLYLQVNSAGSDAVVKVDTLGLGNFTSPDQTITLLSAQGLNMTLDQLLAQRVVLV